MYNKLKFSIFIVMIRTNQLSGKVNYICDKKVIKSVKTIHVPITNFDIVATWIL